MQVRAFLSCTSFVTLDKCSPTDGRLAKVEDAYEYIPGA